MINRHLLERKTITHDELDDEPSTEKLLEPSRITIRF
jgi:hypothetical protein